MPSVNSQFQTQKSIYNTYHGKINRDLTNLNANQDLEQDAAGYKFTLAGTTITSNRNSMQSQRNNIQYQLAMRALNERVATEGMERPFNSGLTSLKTGMIG